MKGLELLYMAVQKYVCVLEDVLFKSWKNF